ncbi:MAG: adenylate/guanylate cyclase domain-containing protein [Spartobacteria bacterium]
MHWLNRNRLWVIAGICAVLTALVIGLHFAPGIPFFSNVWLAEQNVRDLLGREGRKTPTRTDFVFLGIDEESRAFQPFDPAQIANNRPLQLMAEKPYPWSREVWAHLLDRLIGAGARLVIFDVTFESDREGDAEFGAALERYRDKVVLGANIEFANANAGTGAKTVGPNATLIPPPPLMDDRVGYVVFFPDPADGKIRQIRYTITDMQLAFQKPIPGEVPYEALSARAMRKLGRADDVPRDSNEHMLRFSPMDAFQPLKLWEVFDGKVWHANFQDGAFFKDKVIILGASSQIAHDVFETPLGPQTPGPALHLHALAAALGHEFLRATSNAVNFVCIVIAGILAWVALALVRRPLACLFTVLGIAVVYLGIVRLVYDSWGLLILVVPTLATFLGSGLIGLGFEYALERMEKMRTRRTLERYVSKNLVKEILENPDSYYHSMLGSRKPVTVLFSDLVGFTSLSEKADPATLVKQLNEYLSGMVGHVFNNLGTLDKFIGDAIMAVWGNVSSQGVAGDATAAVRTALGMRKELAKLNERWRSEARPELGFGIGINHGEAIIGNIGSCEPHERLDPTVIGDSVNLASRLEALTRTYAVDILIGPSAAELVRDEFHLRSVARVQVKGKTQPVEVFTLLGARNEDVDPELLKWVETYEQGVIKFRERDFTEAKILFSRFLEFYPDDFLAKMYLERTLEYEQQPPDEAWNAVEVFKKK